MPREIPVEMGERSYPIVIGSGLSGGAGGLGIDASSRRVVVIADQYVFDLHADRLRALLPDAEVLTFPRGESSKSLEQFGALSNALAELRVERRDAIASLGGGVAGDLAGFLAATWLRGVDFYQIPTTTEAAVDASVGGKTAINLPSGKNLVGAFYQPRAVLIDLEFLSTLDERDYRAGLAESVKHGGIRDPQLLQTHLEQADRILQRDPATLEELIATNCAIKAAVVAADEREANLRAILNYGHTIGHAIEHELSYELRHGECVGLGMIAENDLAVRRGLFDAASAQQIRDALVALALPVKLPRAIDVEAVVERCTLDKKNVAGQIHIVALRAIGDPLRLTDVDPDEIRASLEILAA